MVPVFFLEVQQWLLQDFYIEKMQSVLIAFFLFAIVISIFQYFQMYGKKELAKHLPSFIAWIVVSVLISVPYVTLVYLSIIPQAYTSIGNMIICAVFFFLVMCGYAYAHVSFMDKMLDVKDFSSKSRLLPIIYALVYAVPEYLISYFLNFMVVRNTDMEIYASLYGENVAHFLRVFGNVH